MEDEAGKRQLTAFADLDRAAQELVELAWKMSEQAYCPYSKFPVGAAIRALNPVGEERVFGGCNVENASYGGAICAERTAAVKAVSEGFVRFTAVAVVCAAAPGGSPCGICRQFLREFGKEATIYNVSDRSSSVSCWTMAELLPDSFGPESL